MHICVFEDSGAAALEPLSLTRPVFDLRCGAVTLLERQQRAFGADRSAALVRPYLADLCRQQHLSLVVNDLNWLAAGPAVLVNARWLPPAEQTVEVEGPRVGLVGDHVAYVAAPAVELSQYTPEILEEWVEHCKEHLPHVPAGGTLMRYPWDLVEHNPASLREDFHWFSAREEFRPPPQELTVVGPPEQVLVHPSAHIEPFVVADSTNGPVILDRDVRLHSFTRLEGPCYVGAESWLLGAKLRGGTIGPRCRVGGEVEASILHAHANKYHDGFLGHSYLGEWVNLAAGTQASDLRNDYGPVRVWVNDHKIDTGLTKVGVFLGDHTKTGLNVLLNTGTVTGVFSNLLPEGRLLPTLIPSFCTHNDGQLQERWDLRQLFATASTVMARRGCELTGAHTDLFFALYELTASSRRHWIREREQRRLRRTS